MCCICNNLGTALVNKNEGKTILNISKAELLIQQIYDMLGETVKHSRSKICIWNFRIYVVCVSSILSEIFFKTSKYTHSTFIYIKFRFIESIPLVY